MELQKQSSISKQKSFITHAYSKSDLMGIWNIGNEKQFLRMIGEEGKKILDWKPGKMRFTPNQLRKILDLVGKPIEKSEYQWDKI